MTGLMGPRGRKQAGYPSPPNSAGIALLNRYLTSPDSSVSIDPFTVTSPTFSFIAAANVVRRASGIFMVQAQMPLVLAGADTMQFSVVIFFGQTATGGTPSGDWLVADGATIVIAGSEAAVPSAYSEAASAGNLTKTMTLIGCNPNPTPAGPSAIALVGTTVGGTQISPNGLFISAYELP